MAHQSLYRRYRPRRFGEVRGQDHVIRALRNAVETDTVGHAYLFSGPRGTGKTSTARILAKALNCEDLHDGEPCCECESCVEMEAGRSFDLFELDAASNNGVDAIRDLVERASVGSPGRTKVYILDEVHMLSTPASNALLKTLEEPPGHVCFVLATTDPQKVLPTVRSRTQHYDFQLLSAQELTDYVHWIAQDAPLDIDEESVAYVVRQGRGSARDTLSALDQVVAAGGVVTRVAPVDRLLRAIADHDSGGAVLAVSDALALGNDPRVLADRLLAELRDAFLLSLDVEVTHLVDTDSDRLGEWARTLGTPTLTRAMEAVGSATVDMRNAADPRVPLDVALVRLCTTPSKSGGETTADAGIVADLVRRIEILERAAAGGDTPADRPAAPPPTATVPAAPPRRGPGTSPVEPDADADASTGSGGPAAARAALGAVRAAREKRTVDERPVKPVSGTTRHPPTPPAPRVDPGRPATAEPAPDRTTPATVPAPGSGSSPDRDALTLAFGDVVLPSLRGVAKSVFGGGRFVTVTERGAVFEVENAPTRERAEKYRGDVEAALSAHFGVPVTLVLSDAMDPIAHGPVGGTSTQPSAGQRSGEGSDDTDTDTDTDDADDTDTDDESAIIDVHDLEDADVAATGVEKLTQAFPGAVLVEGPDGAG